MKGGNEVKSIWNITAVKVDIYVHPMSKYQSYVFLHVEIFG